MKEFYCEYGCGQEAKFQLKSGKWICSKNPAQCIVNKKKNSETNKIKSWIKGKTKNSDKRVLNMSLTKVGKSRSDSTKKKLSKKRIEFLEHNDSYCKWFEFFNGKRNIKVQGTWEKRFVEFLILKNIKWDRVRISFNKNRTYTPDFYLPDYNMYVEVKGWMREGDKYKMWKVLHERFIDLRLIEDIKIIESLDKKSIMNLEKFQEKYPEDKIDFSKFKNVWD